MHLICTIIYLGKQLIIGYLAALCYYLRRNNLSNFGYSFNNIFMTYQLVLFSCAVLSLNTTCLEINIFLVYSVVYLVIISSDETILVHQNGTECCEALIYCYLDFIFGSIELFLFLGCYCSLILCTSFSNKELTNMLIIRNV